jgi:hypothetical protein
MRSRLTFLTTLVVLLAVAALPGLALAQTESGKILGSISDASGGVLPGATVTARSVGTSATRTTTTDAAGQFNFAGLQPGPYEVSVELSGFASKQFRVELTVGASVSVNAKLEVGQQSEVITVLAGEGVTVNTVTQDIATTINEKQIRELPTITRNPYDLVALSGNVNDAQVGDNDANFTPRGSNGFSLNGQRASGVNVLLDGASNNDEYTASLGQAVPLDSVQEFSVITSNFSAQYGRATGGIVNVATKSGTNEFHGTAYEFFRNASLATNTFDNKARGIDKGEFSRHQSGFSLGGPLVKDKLHFFASGEYIRVRSQAGDIALVPTPEFLARTSPTTQAFFNQFPLAIPINGPVLTAGELAGVIPGGAFSRLPSSLPVFGQVQRTLPVDAGGGFPVDDYQIVSRVDWNVGPNTSAYVRYAYQDQKFPVGANSNSPYQGFDTDILAKNHNLLASATHIWSPKLTTQSKFAWTQLTSDQPLGSQPPVPGLYMRTSQTTINGLRIALPGYLPYNPGLALPSGGPQKQAQFYQDVNYLAGAHDLRLGGQFVRIMDDHSFGAYQSSVQTLGASFGQALDNLVLGRIAQFNGAIDPQGKFPGDTITLPVDAPQFFRRNRYNEFALYANDTWSVRSRLKLNLGMRYEYFGVQHNSDPSLDANFYFGEGANLFERVKNGNVFRAPDSSIGSLWKPDRNNFAPRVGFAWDVNGDGRTSVRGGYGIGYERNFGNVTFNVIQNPPNYAVLGIAATAANPFPIFLDNAGPLAGTGTRVLPAVTLRAVDPNIKTAYAHFWSASLQRELFHNTIASVEYTGSKGVSLYDIDYANRPGAGMLVGQSRPNGLLRPNGQYGNINLRGNGGKSLYHGLSVGVESRSLGSTGLALTARYTLGHAKDNLSSTFSDGNNVQPGGIGYLDALDKNLDYGDAQFDVRHRFVTSGIWEVPAFKNRQGLARTLLGGWQLAYIFTAQSGAAFTIYDCTNELFQCARLNQVAPINAYTKTATGDPNTFSYLDLTNQLPGAGSIADSVLGTNELAPDGGYPASMTKRGAFRRPGRWNLDATLSKRFRFTDRYALQIRFEAYNVLNHANLYINDASADISAGTAITAFRGFTNTAGVPGDGQRRIQLGAKFEF